MIEYSLSQRMDSSLKPEIHQKPHQKQNASLVLILSLSFISLRFIIIFFFLEKWNFFFTSLLLLYVS